MAPYTADSQLTEACNTRSTKQNEKSFCEEIPSHFEAHCRLLVAMCSDIDSLFSKKISQYLQLKDYTSLIAHNVDPNAYSSAFEYHCDKQLEALIGKYPNWPVSTEVDRANACILKFLEAETENRRRNMLFCTSLSHISNDTRKVMNLAREIIWDTLGTVPHIHHLPVVFGKGSCFGLKRSDADPYSKLECLEMTRSAQPFFQQMIDATPGWGKAIEQSGTNIKIIEGNRLFSVPKNCKEDRVCAQEPNINGTMQKMFGSVIRNLVRDKFGLLRPTAQQHHGNMARNASVLNNGATVDAKNASGSITTGCVQFYLPPEWFSTLDALRSQRYTVDDEDWYEYEQFSSMGNGFTFELETLIFYAIARAACIITGSSTSISRLSTYGDDVIIPTDALDLFLKGFKHSGFEVNTSKSFSDGLFRESCGFDWFDGINVRPVFVRDSLSARTMVTIHNQMLAYDYDYYYPKFFELLLELIHSTNLGISHGPQNGSDGHLHSRSWSYGVPFVTYTQKVTFAPLSKTVFDNINKQKKKVKTLKKTLHIAKSTKIQGSNRAAMRSTLFSLKTRLSKARKRLKNLKEVEWHQGNDFLLPFALYLSLTVQNHSDEDCYVTDWRKSVLSKREPHYIDAIELSKACLVSDYKEPISTANAVFRGRMYENDSQRYIQTTTVIF